MTQRSELTGIFNRFMNRHHPFTGVRARFGRPNKPSDKTTERKKQRNFGKMFHNTMKQGTYKNKT